MPRKPRKGAAKTPPAADAETTTEFEAEWTRPPAEADNGEEAAAPATSETQVSPEAGTETAAELERLRRELADAQERAKGVLEIERLRRELAEAKERADRFHSNWQRSAADFQNWKRRADQEKAEAGKLAEAALATDLLRVLDDFERAFQSLPPELRTLTWIEGMALIGQKLYAILQGRGLEPIEAVGQDFDPHLHEAVMREDDGDPSEQTAVVADLQRGYRFHGRVIRPSLVKVGKPKASAAETSAADAGVPEASAEGSPP